MNPVLCLAILLSMIFALFENPGLRIEIRNVLSSIHRTGITRQRSARRSCKLIETKCSEVHARWGPIEMIPT